MPKTLFFIILISLVCLLSSEFARADTVYKNDGEELKGIVVEDYKDRITFSTADGEIAVMKSDISELYYDSEEANLIKLAERSRDRGEYTKSFAYYDMAFRLNPDSKAARDGIVSLQGTLFRKEQAKKEDEIKSREEFEQYGVSVAVEKSEEEELKESAKKLKETMGMAIKMEKNTPEIYNVRANSPAYEAGIRNGDKLVEVWGKLTGYMQLKDIMGVLLEKPSLEIKCTVERAVDVTINKSRGLASGSRELIGALLTMEFDGLTVSEVKEQSAAAEVGLAKNDLIMAIDGDSTRYMPLKKAIDLIRNSKNESVRLTLRKKVLIWRKGEL